MRLCSYSFSFELSGGTYSTKLWGLKLIPYTQVGQGGDGEVEVGHLWGDISSPACMREREPVTLIRLALATSPLPLLLWDVNVGGKHYLQMSFHRA